MTRFKADWKSPLALLIAVLALYLASLKIDVHRAAEARPQAPATAPAPDGKPVSNDIPDLQQLG